MQHNTRRDAPLESDLALALREVWDPLTAAAGHATRLDAEVSRSYTALPSSIILGVTGLVAAMTALQQTLLGVRAVTGVPLDGHEPTTDVAAAIERILGALERTHSRIEVTFERATDPAPLVAAEPALVETLLWLVVSTACERAKRVTVRLDHDATEARVHIQADAGTHPPLEAGADHEPTALVLARRVAALATVGLDLRAIVPLEARLTCVVHG